MGYLPIILREDNYPQINFRKLAVNRNRKLYLCLNAVKGVFTRFINPIPAMTESIDFNYIYVDLIPNSSYKEDNLNLISQDRSLLPVKA
jgi:uncharacterized pyridoxamine 5'-phosphate oxidase family protein